MQFGWWKSIWLGKGESWDSCPSPRPRPTLRVGARSKGACIGEGRGRIKFNQSSVLGRSNHSNEMFMHFASGSRLNICCLLVHSTAVGRSSFSCRAPRGAHAACSFQASTCSNAGGFSKNEVVAEGVEIAGRCLLRPGLRRGGDKDVAVSAAVLVAR